MKLLVECTPPDGLGTFWEKTLDVVTIPRVHDEMWIHLSDGAQRLYRVLKVTWSTDDENSLKARPKMKVVQVPL